ncbi:MAG: site-specific integrase, partial [Planctomycetota bacterium]
MDAGGRRPQRSGEPIERFLRFLSAEKAASPLTLKSYREDLLQLDEFLRSAGCRTPGEATTTVLRRFAAGLHAAGYAASTVARKLASMRSFYAFGQREGWVRTNPAKPLRGPRRPRKLPRFLTGDEIARLLATPRPAEPGGSRDRAILELMYSSGCRVRELVGLDDLDLDLRNATVRIRGKGRRERLGIVG